MSGRGRILGSVVAFALLMPAPVESQNAVRYGSACGIERWAIKTLIDSGTSKLPATPVDTTILHLVSMRPSANTGWSAVRLAPMETTLWRIKAQIVAVRPQPDSDLHVILRDPVSGMEMLGEIPAPFCTSSHQATAFAAARKAVVAMRLPSTAFVTGYGFYDRCHRVRGQARNCAELHPVIRVETASHR